MHCKQAANKRAGLAMVECSLASKGGNIKCRIDFPSKSRMQQLILTTWCSWVSVSVWAKGGWVSSTGHVAHALAGRGRGDPPTE